MDLLVAEVIHWLLESYVAGFVEFSIIQVEHTIVFTVLSSRVDVSYQETDVFLVNVGPMLNISKRGVNGFFEYSCNLSIYHYNLG